MKILPDTPNVSHEEINRRYYATKVSTRDIILTVRRPRDPSMPYPFDQSSSLTFRMNRVLECETFNTPTEVLDVREALVNALRTLAVELEEQIKKRI